MDIPFIYAYYLNDAEFLRLTLADFAIGLIFALAGAAGILVKTSRENKEAALRTEVLE